MRLNYLSDNSRPAIVNGDNGAVDQFRAPAAGQGQAHVGYIVELAHGRFDGAKDLGCFVFAFHVDTGVKGVDDVSVHAAQHQPVAPDALVTVEGGRVLGQPDKTVLARCVCCAFLS
jgi:hypothetical protein